MGFFDVRHGPELFEGKFRSCRFVQSETLVLSNQGLLHKRWHDELQYRQRLKTEQVRLLNPDSAVLGVLPDQCECLVNSQVLGFEDLDVFSQDLHESGLLLFEEVDFGVAGQL